MKPRKIFDGLFGAAILAAMIFPAALPWSRLVQKVTMEKFHYVGDSFPTWAALQLVPSMYNFENTSVLIWPMADRFENRQFWPHHPFYDIGHSPEGKTLLPGISGISSGPITRLASRYRGAQLVTDFEVKKMGDGGFAVVELTHDFRHD
ncbi:hypothetical protein OAF27_01970 [Verrucomicrobiales bacterium]|nr:hypothetical protein [Verrucomicrobiales bacterium]